MLQTAKKARHASLLTRTFKVAREARVTRVATRPHGHVGRYLPFGVQRVKNFSDINLSFAYLVYTLVFKKQDITVLA